jgi:hypothetical protein
MRKTRLGSIFGALMHLFVQKDLTIDGLMKVKGFPKSCKIADFTNDFGCPADS